MKKLLTFCILIIALGCSKQSDPQPSTPNTQSQGLTQEELEVVGNWISRTMDVYDASGNLLNSVTFTDSISCHLELRSGQNQVNASYNHHDATYSLGCSAIETGWARSGSYLTLDYQQFYILSLSPDTMRLKGPGLAYAIYLVTR